MKTLQDVADANNLIEAFRKAKEDSAWKESVQRYEAHLLENTWELQQEILNGTYRQKPFFEFDIHERGKVRHIKSLYVRDRVLQRSLCDNVLSDLYRYCIYDNGASQKGKGVDFARRRLELHLKRYIRKHGAEGYILKIDFRKFFDNIPHKELLDLVFTKIKDEGLQNLIRYIIGTFRIDVSYMSNEEYRQAQSVPFDSLKYCEASRGIRTGEKYLNVSMGIGAQVSQIAGIVYPTRIDAYCKYVKGCKFYGRYMDDIYIIHDNKEFLKQLCGEIKTLARKMKMFVHTDKTQIFKLSKGFVFLQIRYRVTQTGKTIKVLSKKSTVRERRRLKRLAKLAEKGVAIDVRQCYKSWRGNAIKYHAWHRIQALDKLVLELLRGDVKNDT